MKYNKILWLNEVIIAVKNRIAVLKASARVITKLTVSFHGKSLLYLYEFQKKDK